MVLLFSFILTTLLPAQQSLQNKLQPEFRHQKEIKIKKRILNKIMETRGATTNQEKYDVSYYLLNLDIILSTNRIRGFVQINAKVVDGPISNMELNFFDNMIVDSIIYEGSMLTFTHQNDILDVNLGKEFSTGQNISIKIYYQGDPSQSGSGAFVFTSYAGKPHFWTLSEPYGAREWWPCKDVPEDKADSADIIVTVPENMIVASNGILVSEGTHGSQTTFHWQERYPIVTYLISLAGYEYYHYSDTYQTLSGDTMPIEFFVYPDHYPQIGFQENYSRTKEMITAFAGYFGEYPFVNEKYGHAEFNWLGGGMEHQTCSSLSGWDLGLIAHELAHQWWGDMITCKNFHHIWLNEGFATYSEALWREYDEGIEAYHQEMSYNAYKGPGTIYVEDDTDENAIFDSNLSYSKAAYVLHMLRHIVGDSIFFEILKTYHKDQRFKYGTAVTEDFQAVCEAVSGMNLTKFFQQWIYGEYYPSYEYSWSATETGGQYQIQLQINQVQTNTGLFWMPIDVNIHMVNSDTVIVVWDSLQTQNFTLYVDDQPQNLGLDEDNWILCDKQEVPSFVQENHLPSVKEFQIVKAYPNPFNPRVKLEFFLNKPGIITLDVYDALGKRVQQIKYPMRFASGLQQIIWDGSNFATGIYYIALKKENQRKIVKVFLLK